MEDATLEGELEYLRRQIYGRRDAEHIRRQVAPLIATPYGMISTDGGNLYAGCESRKGPLPRTCGRHRQIACEKSQRNGRQIKELFRSNRVCLSNRSKMLNVTFAALRELTRFQVESWASWE